MEKQVKDFNVFIEQDEDGIYVAKVPEIEGCYTQGKTLEEVIKRIKEAIEVCLEADREEINPMRFVGIQRVSVGKSQSA
ncbi:HicB family protein [Candidatus Pacearchaeota archaeon]|nr:HicB family protein [Candidatus Pacearchaeota archaeon]|tara:strand:- start:409 stop:645 length:237 start_codon:yes stop_codon:yes gene_type:complete